MNHLSNSTSPYLLQHAHNPVEWYPWGDEALSLARRENKPIFLSIGYAACHWCHVMAHESFEDPAIAQIMNDNFVSIKVDREQRPDLDSIYMQATQAMTGSGGWPMSIFLTPDLHPFFAGTYFPPTSRYNLPSFREVLLSVKDAWQNQREEIEEVGSKVLRQLEQVSPGSSTAANPLTQKDLDQAAAALLQEYDWGYGGWGSAPKFPQPMIIEYLLRRSLIDGPHRDACLKAAVHALKAMARGGMYDVVGGGFARYSTDHFWRVPHFEKMLYDNAQLALAYLHAWLITREPSFKRITTETLDFIKRELASPEGGFYSSLDADSEGREGKYYVWTADEIQRSLGSEADFFFTAYGITERGNWEGKTVLQRAIDDASLASRFKLTEQQVDEKLKDCHNRLRAVREQCVRPGTDDKVLAAWNGWGLQAFAEASRYLDDTEKTTEYLDTATRSADFLLSQLRPQGELHRAWRAGLASPEVFLEDFSALALALLELYQTDYNPRWFTAAQELADEIIRRFADPDGGFFDTPGDGESLLIRPRDVQDNATPSGNSMAAEALIKLAAYTDQGLYRDLAEKSIGRVSVYALRYPAAFARWLSVADLALAKIKQVALLYESQAGARPLIDVLRSEYRPGIVAAAASVPPPPGGPALLENRDLLDRRPTAYVCEGFVCKLPVTGPEELKKQLQGS